MTVTIYLTLFTQANPKGAVKISGATPCTVHAESWGTIAHADLRVSWLRRAPLSIVSLPFLFILIPLLGNSLLTSPNLGPAPPSASSEMGTEAMCACAIPPPRQRTRRPGARHRAWRAGGDAAPRATYVFTVDVGFTGAAEQLPPQEVPVVLQEGQVEVAEELHVLVLHPQLLGGVPVNDLAGRRARSGSEDLAPGGSHGGALA